LPEVRRVRKRALEEVLEQVQRAVEMLRDADADLGVSLSEDTAAAPPEGEEDRKGHVGVDGDDVATSASVASDSDYETAQVSRRRLDPSRVLLGTSRVPGTRIWISEVVATGVTEYW
jgi:hypothetical protein